MDWLTSSSLLSPFSKCSLNKEPGLRPTLLIQFCCASLSPTASFCSLSYFTFGSQAWEYENHTVSLFTLPCKDRAYLRGRKSLQDTKNLPSHTPEKAAGGSWIGFLPSCRFNPRHTLCVDNDRGTWSSLGPEVKHILTIFHLILTTTLWG